MRIIQSARTIYRRFIRVPLLDRAIYACLDLLTDLVSTMRGYSFPKNYIRRWKLDMLWGLYEKETVALTKDIVKPGMVVLDIGAHIGYFTRLYSTLVGDRGMVYAFEADPENFSILKKNTEKLRNVKIFELAASDTKGTIDFYHYDEKAGCHSTLSNVPLEYPKRKITVPADRVDDVLLREQVSCVDFVKMDIEGGESSAMRGMQTLLSGKHPLIILTEFAPAWIEASGVAPLRFLQELSEKGFSISAIMADTLVPLDTKSEEGYMALVPKTPTHFNEFINLYCVRR